MVKTKFSILFMLFISSISCINPKNYQTKFNKLYVVVREANTQKPLEGANVVFQDKTKKTTNLGFAKFCVKHRNLVGLNYLHYNHEEVSGRHLITKYNNVYNLYIDKGYSIPTDRSHKFADMHYHTSLKCHNLFYNEYDKQVTPVINTLNWFYRTKNLKVFINGCKKRPYFGSKTKNTSSRKYIRMESLINHKVFPPNKTINSLVSYTQATHMHTLSGNVKLAYNSISPFESNIANTEKKRFAASRFVSGANGKWLKRIGQADQQKFPMSHYDNFNKEHDYLTQQLNTTNALSYKFYNGKNTDDQIAQIVNVVEGGHILQNQIIPNVLQYHPETIDSTLVLKTFLKVKSSVEKIYNHCQLRPLSPIDKIAEFYCVDPDFNKLFDSYYEADLTLKTRLLPTDTRMEGIKEAIEDKGINYLKTGVKRHLGLPESSIEGMKEYIDTFFNYEIKRSIQKIKDPLNESAKIRMITIAHFAYNGLLGQANPFDGGGWFTSNLAKRNYGLSISQEKGYLDQWMSTFYTIPGITKHGITAIKDLLDERIGGYKLLIDLKHSDPESRDYFYKHFMKKDDVPPICSHCAANGLESYVYSPVVNEYAFLKNPLHNNLYPFSINLYDDEIPLYFKNGGIIGIVFEERGLGSYVNEKIKNRITGQKLRKDVFFKDYIDTLYHTGSSERKNLHDRLVKLMIICKDFYNINGEILSGGTTESIALEKVKDEFNYVEPFLTNLFYFIDHSGMGEFKEYGIRFDSAWMHLCIGSDYDGIIDPIDASPTASTLPRFKDKVKWFIPLFIDARNETEFYHSEKKSWQDYFENEASLDRALDFLFYESLLNFTYKYMR